MLFRALAVLALAAGGHAMPTEAELGAILNHLHHHHEMFRVVVRERIQSHHFPMHKCHLKAETCDECHQGAAKWTMEHAMGKLKEMCVTAAQKECKMAKICGMMAKKPEVTMGMMIEHVRPFALTAAFCMGKGVCKPSNDTLAEIEMGMQPHDVLLGNFDKIDWQTVMDEASDLAPKEEDKEENEDQEEKEEPENFGPVCEMEQHHHHNVCPKCMKHSIKKVMKHALKHIVGKCESTNCPKMQKMCGWAKEHKGTAFGMLLAKVEPWKFAFGHCMHKKHDGWHILKHIAKKAKETLENFGSDVTHMISI